MSRTVTIFTAKKCAPCNVLKKRLKNAKFNFDLIDIEEHPKKAQEARIRSVPTILVEDVETGFKQCFIGAGADIVGLIEETLKGGN
jgi:glutaredoxin